MNVVELTVIGSQNTEKEKLFSLVTEEPLRNFKGLKFGYLPLDDDKSIHFYFLNQEKEKYLYLWDLIVPHSLAVIVVCDGDDPHILRENISVITKLNNTYATPCFICPINHYDRVIEEIEKSGIDTQENNRILNFEANDKENAKKVLTDIFSNLANV